MSLKHFQWIRTNSLKLGEAVDESVLREVPQGFNNNILWHLGHLVVSTENILFKASGRETQLTDTYASAFGAGTSPKIWTSEEPTREDVLSQLAEQSKRMADTFEGHEDDALPKEITIAGNELRTVADLLEFNAFHETIHLTTIRLYNKLLNAAD